MQSRRTHYAITTTVLVFLFGHPLVVHETSECRYTLHSRGEEMSNATRGIALELRTRTC
ncbi:hypothetical protein M404DRAFT_1003698 [Pisolithus tinctorius Marx 270]|uniref:Secreted protein n=1 Tax=Pisolithus tinctorius Marx 270 TaxID=870435 RepID=A0A0C3JT79_PISTI|nr:hypothetical protein M404DRAFT_1003698 [Pisolithus tinctorius Marx 270]